MLQLLSISPQQIDE
jgi:hypothetical protein